MNRVNIIGYISAIVGVVFLAIAFGVFQKYAEGNLMSETYFCISSVCLSRVDIFFPVFIAGYISLALSLALLGEHIVSKLMQLVFGR